jgi:SAM-dependent methyltransferase
LSAGSQVLEVGCGTGKLTELLATRGLQIVAVDPGPNMIQAARKRLGATDAVRFHVARFEDASLPGESFAAVFSATAFHWLDPAIAWHKAAAHLEPRGMLALLAHIGLRDEQTAEHESEFRGILRRHAPELAKEMRPLRDLQTILTGIEQRRGNASEVWDWVMGDGRHAVAIQEAAELFEAVEVMTLVANIEKTADELLARFRTTSLYFRIDPDRRRAFEDDDRRLVERFGGTVRFSEAAVLMTARRH